MYIIKRNGERENVSYDKITHRNMKLANDLNVDATSLSQKVISGLASGMTTREIDELSCQNAIHSSIYEPDYEILATRIAVNDLHKSIPATFSEKLDILFENKGGKTSLIHPSVYKFAKENMEKITAAIDYSRDYNLSYFGFKTLAHSYLLKVGGKIVESPQDMLMRVNLGIHGPSVRNGKTIAGDIDKCIASFKEQSDGKFTHASPTLFNAGTNRPQMSSCFVLSCPDSMGDDEYDEAGELNAHMEESIPETWRQCSKISKYSGGIGVDLTFVRGRGSYINGTNGMSTGLIPLIKVFDKIGGYVNQGGKRNGAISLYLQPWHPDIIDFLRIGLNTGDENDKSRGIFPALWIPDLFFKRLKKNTSSNWSLFCPHKYPELVSLYGDEFEKRYEELEANNMMCATISVGKVWDAIIKSLDETGLPYMCAKDAVNRKSNQKNIGPIYGSNLCVEIMQYHTPTSIAVCNLASICLPKFVDQKQRTFDFQALGYITTMVLQNLNQVVDKNYSPVAYCAKNNLSYRPVGIGVQGLADVFAMMGLSWEDPNDERNPNPESRLLNIVIFEVIYYYALKESARLAVTNGSYDKFEGSPASQGILQYDMWNVVPITDPSSAAIRASKNYSWKIPELDWSELKEQVKKGLYNSLMVAPMPTASTSQIMGNSECFEPFTSNLYSRKVLAGHYPIVNRHLYNDLKKIGAWNKQNLENIIANNGSVQSLDIPRELKLIYKTVWEISQKIIIDMAADRGAFIDQSQSMNIYIARPTKSKTSSMYIYAWEKGLKTLSYYLRSTASVDPVKFTLDMVSDPTKKKGNEHLGEKSSPKASDHTNDSGIKYNCTDDVCIPCSG